MSVSRVLWRSSSMRNHLPFPNVFLISVYDHSLSGLIPCPVLPATFPSLLQVLPAIFPSLLPMLILFPTLNLTALSFYSWAPNLNSLSWASPIWFAMFSCWSDVLRSALAWTLMLSGASGITTLCFSSSIFWVASSYCIIDLEFKFGRDLSIRLCLTGLQTLPLLLKSLAHLLIARVAICSLLKLRCTSGFLIGFMDAWNPLKLHSRCISSVQIFLNCLLSYAVWHY